MPRNSSREADWCWEYILYIIHLGMGGAGYRYTVLSFWVPWGLDKDSAYHRCWENGR